MGRRRVKKDDEDLDPEQEDNNADDQQQQEEDEEEEEEVMHEEEEEEDDDDAAAAVDFDEKLVCTGQTDAERRQIRVSQRQLRHTIGDIDVEAAREKNNRLNRQVRYIREAVLDSENLDVIAQKAAAKVEAIVKVRVHCRYNNVFNKIQDELVEHDDVVPNMHVFLLMFRIELVDQYCTIHSQLCIAVPIFFAILLRPNNTNIGTPIRCRSSD